MLQRNITINNEHGNSYSSSVGRGPTDTVLIRNLKTIEIYEQQNL